MMDLKQLEQEIIERLEAASATVYAKHPQASRIVRTWEATAIVREVFAQASSLECGERFCYGCAICTPISQDEPLTEDLDEEMREL